MVDLECKDTDWVGGNVGGVLDVILQLGGLILGTLSKDQGKCGYLWRISGRFGTLARVQLLWSQMVDLGCHDKDLVSGNDRGVLDVILLLHSLILATLNMDKGKHGYLGSISGWFGTLEGWLT